MHMCVCVSTCDLTVVVQLLSCVQLFATPWTVACSASLSFTISRSLLRFMSIESVMLSNHLILCCLFLLLPSVSGISRYKSLHTHTHTHTHTQWINIKVLLYSTGNFFQYLVINHNGKEYDKECIDTYCWCLVAKSCLSLLQPHGPCRQPCSSVHGIL